MVNRASAWRGKQESAKLEYKSAEALKRPQIITRAVVALLNHRGGHVVVGVDDAGHLLGLGDGVDPARERDRLQALLVDAIEPRPLRLVEVQDATMGGRVVLVVTVENANASKVYAERRQGLYGFWVRAGATTRAYTLEEVRQRWRDSGAPPQAPARWDAPLEAAAEEEIVFALQAQLGEDQALNKRAVEEILKPERRVEVCRRRNGWYVVDEYVQPGRWRREAFEIGAKGERTWLRFDSKQRVIRFEARSDFLTWQPHPAFPGEQVVYPYPLVEGTASFFWLLQQYAKESGVEGTVFCQLGLWRPEGWRLGPRSPDVIAWQHAYHWQPAHDNVNIERDAELEWSNIKDAPDRVAYAFVAEVYEDFGYEDSAIPFWSQIEQRFVFG